MKRILTITILLILSIRYGHTQSESSKPDSINFQRLMRIADSLFNADTPDSIKTEFKGSRYYWIYDGQGNVIGGSKIKRGPQKAVKLVDSLTNHSYILDSAHIVITAYDNSNKILWRTDPYKDNSIMEYRTKRPIIIEYGFGNSPDYFPDKIEKGLKVIWITYNNTQFGFIDLNKGRYYFCGQD